MTLPIFTMAGGDSGGTVTSSGLLVNKPITPPAIPVDMATLPGFRAVPPKLVKRIVAGEYIGIWELLPETWQMETEGCHILRGHAAAW